MTTATELFHQHFGAAPQAAASAHGRVNIIGDHTDYNGGWALPSLLPQSISVALSRQDQAHIDAHSQQLHGNARRELGARAQQGHWLDYVQGCLELYAQDQGQDQRQRAQGIQLTVHSNLPMGNGLSSSAALCIAVLRALRQLYRARSSDYQLALLAQRVEHQYVGLRCGLMDQLVVACGELGTALLLDCASDQHTPIAIAPNLSFAVLSSGSPRKLSDSAYNQRRELCQRSAQQLGYEHISQASSSDLESLPAEAQPLARHVLGENQRTQAAATALAAGDLLSLAEAMNQSHYSLRYDYRVSAPALDSCVAAAIACGARAARMTGAGFGGCVVALCESGQQQSFRRRWQSHNDPLRILAWLGE